MRVLSQCKTHETILALLYIYLFQDQTNTFQLVLATDGFSSFAIFLYLEDGIQWTTAENSDGSNGFGGTEAQVGYDAGDGVNFHSVNGSMTPSIIDIETTSNVNIPGMYIFRLDSIPPGN